MCVVLVCVCVCVELFREAFIRLLICSLSVWTCMCTSETFQHTHTHMHMYISLYDWILLYVCVCVCLSVKAANDEREIIWYSLMLFERWRLEEATAAAMTSQLLSACINLDTYIHIHAYTHTRTRMNIVSLHVQCALHMQAKCAFSWIA